MSQFPTIIPTFTDFDGNQTLAQNNHASRHNKVHEELAALATKVGIDSSTDANSLDKKTATLRTDVTALQASVSPLLVDPTTKAYVDSAISTAVGAAKQALYPIGSYYINETDGTNPGALLGFGTWVAVANRMIVGKGSGTFATAGATGGEETHTLTIAEMPSHSHRQKVVANSGNPVDTRCDFVSDTNGTEYDQGVYSYPEGGGGAHNNMPPYIVAHIWKRTL
mgnify:FL=1